MTDCMGSSAGYPIITTGNLTAEQACAIYCTSCGWVGKQDDPSEGPIQEVGSCPACPLVLTLDYCYEPGVGCAGCGKVDLDMPLRDELGSYCSRVCQLQAEYKRSLGEAA